MTQDSEGSQALERGSWDALPADSEAQVDYPPQVGFKHPLNPRKLVGAILRGELKVVTVEDGHDDGIVELELVLRGKVSAEQWAWMCR